jgi:hypothetical protein
MAKTLKLELPPEVLAQHIAVLGKTGSGKTSTAKLIVEQVAAGEARVCVLDPIKSDWWGLTSSASGKQAGLPFHILGGPHGHVPLHSSAGAAIAEIVANGSLPLSVIDMADFEPGGISRFFVDFAPVLLKKMRGVVYLVIEEAHLFAPKERAGLDKAKENLSIHWAKTMATAGRSKGIRLIVATQRTQALHNAVLGSCDTVIAHRLTAPADQKPVIEWLKANAEPDVMKRVASSLAGLKTGHAWLCSGEARVFEERAFPRISTYDNTATPTGDGAVLDIKTAPVDQDRLRSIIGGAVEEAKANDPKELRKVIQEKDRIIQSLNGKVIQAEKAAPAGKDAPVMTDADRAQMAKLGEVVSAAASLMNDALILAGQRFRSHLERAIDEHGDLVVDAIAKAEKGIASDLSKVRMVNLLDKLNRLAQANPNPGPIRQAAPPTYPEGQPGHHVPRAVPARKPGRSGDGARPAGEGRDATPAEERMLDALRRSGGQLSRRALAIRSGYALNGGGFRNTLSSLRTKGYIVDGQGGAIVVGPSVTVVDEPFSDEEIQGIWRGKLSPAEWRMLEVLISERGAGLSRAELAQRANYDVNGGGFRNTLSAINSAALVDKDGGTVSAAAELFA